MTTKVSGNHANGSTQFWNLDSPKMARDFIDKIRCGADKHKIEWYALTDGTRILVKDATDEQIVALAHFIADMMKEEQKQ